MSYASRGSGGGGGFGGFPYRSAHQQNNDGNDRNNNHQRRKRHQKRKERGGALICRASLKIPVGSRRTIIGRKGHTIKRLTERTKTVIDVPGMRNVNPNARVQIRGSCVAYVLHACWELSHLLLPFPLNEGDDVGAQHISEDENEQKYIAYELSIEGVDGILKGKLLKRGTVKSTNSDHADDLIHDHDPRNTAFMIGQKKGNRQTSDSSSTDANHGMDENDGIFAFCISTQKNLAQENVSIWVDNERFVDSTITANVDVIPINGRTNVGAAEDNDLRSDAAEEGDIHESGDDASTLVFIYGATRERPGHLYAILSKKVLEYETL